MDKKNVRNEVNLSAVITVHNEGLIAHKTMRSVFEALKRVEEAGYNYEIIIHIDNGDDETKEYFSRYENNSKIRIFENHFGDSGPSRNFALEKANGRYITFLDGDDLISDNWYIEAIKMLKASDEEIIVHPEAILTFGIGQQKVLTLQKDSFEDEKDTLILLGENRWCSVLMAKKETVAKILYQKMETGYGHEDYVFNINALEKGIHHKIARETILFYRRSDKSRLSLSNKENDIIPYVDYFDFERVKILKMSAKKEAVRGRIRKNGYKVYKKIRGNNFLNFFITPVAKATIKILKYETKNVKVPDFVIQGWKKINKIETQLYPFSYFVSEVVKYSAEEHLEVGRTFYKISKCVRQKPDYVFIVPWVVRGGADKVLFNYIEALKEVHPDWHITVISTLPVKNFWVKKIPEYVDFIDFGNLSDGLVPYDRDILFSRVITQLGCKRLQIINSQYGYDWVREHEGLIKKHYELNVSIFAWNYIMIPGTNEKAIDSYDDPYLFEIYNAVNKVFTDNESMAKYMIEHDGFNSDNIITHYQPIKNLNLLPIKSGLIEDGKLHILWAGRVASVKLPELVAKIGKYLNPKKVSIDVYGEINDDVDKNIFKNIKAINYCGTYDGFDSLPVEKYDLLLYTSLSDGMPNVILEATAAGLPIIASNDGGVGEFIQNGKTGILVEDYLNYRAYIEAIEGALEKPEVLEKYVKNAQKLLLERHNWNKFLEVVKKDIKD